MLRTKALIRLTFLAAAISWLVLVFGDAMILFSDIKGLAAGVPLWLPRVMFDLYVLSLFYYYKLKIERDENLNFTDLLWKVFATGLVATVISLAIRLVLYMLGSTKLTSYIMFGDVIYQINLALFISFLIASYTSWKRLIHYQKSKWLIRTWVVFEFSLLFVLVCGSLKIVFSESVSIVATVLLGLVALVLSANMKWVAYLNFKQKWTSLLLLLLTFFYISYFFYTVTNQSEIIRQQSASFAVFGSHIFNLSLFTFVLMYSIFSFLVIMFNLPTSSVFEQKLEEVVNFQRISQSIQTEQNEESVYNILLESSVRSVFADAAWLEIQRNPAERRLFTYRIDEAEAIAVRDHLKNNNIKGILDQGSDKTKNMSKHLSTLKGYRFRSILAFPIQVKGETIGTLVKE